VSKSVDTPPSPYYIGVHIHVFCNSKRELKDILPQKLETILKHNSNAIINNSIPPAIIKLNIVISNSCKICDPATPNITNNIPAVSIAVLDTVLCSSFSNFFVNAMNNGIFPIGSITTNSAITAVIISFWKVLGILNRSWKIWKKYCKIVNQF
jgi:hypothetical protein